MSSHGATGKESGGASREHEQFSYGYDVAGNLQRRTNNALVQDFTVNSLSELTTVGRSGTYTAAGGVQGNSNTVTVMVADNGNPAQDVTPYADSSFARAGVTLLDGTNTFTAVATDTYSRWDTDAVTAYLPATASYAYDLNGNLRSDGRRHFTYDDENQLLSVVVTNATRSDFVYDGKMRRRVRKEYVWRQSAWVLAQEVRYVYDGNLVIQERNGLNLAQVTYTRGHDLSGTLEGAGGIGGLLARTNHSTLNSPLKNPEKV